MAPFRRTLAAGAFGMLALLASADDCLFNATHCACSTTGNAGGTCFRHYSGPQTGAMCTAETCKAGGHVCDCLGGSLCARSTCGVWRAADTSAKPEPGSVDIPCIFDSVGKCVEKLAASLPAPEKKNKEKPAAPVEYKMVQMGAKSVRSMWNMTFEKDSGDYLTKRFADGKGKSLHGAWPRRDALKARQINMRLYRGDSDPTRMLVCAIINTWGVGNDGLGNYAVESTVTGVDGLTLSFEACDDWSAAKGAGECKAPVSGTKLHARHSGIATLSDGWCVGPLDINGDAVSVKFSGVQRLEGINFLGSDGEEEEFTFLESGEDGLTGQVDKNGLVQNGVVPEIIIKPSGIPVP